MLHVHMIKQIIKLNSIKSYEVTDCQSNKPASNEEYNKLVE
jgi:hypothetical protein